MPRSTPSAGRSNDTPRTGGSTEWFPHPIQPATASRPCSGSKPENFAAADEQLYLYAVASKRKTPYEIAATGRQPLSPSEFALGHLLRSDGKPLRPEGAAAAWCWAALGGREPDWIDEPAISHIPVTRYADLVRLDRSPVEPRPWDTLVVAQVDRIFGTNPDGVIPRPVALYRNGFTCDQGHWYDFATGEALPPAAPLPTEPSTHALAAERPLFLRTLRGILTAHIRAPERKALGPSGSPCTSRTEGRLQPARTEAYNAVAIGREANYSHEAGILADPDYTLYPDSSRDTTRNQVLRVLRAATRTSGQRKVANALGLSESALRRYLKSGRARARIRAVAEQHAAELARSALAAAHPGQPLPTHAEALLYLATRKGGPFRVTRCANCNAPLEGRQRRWCRRCRAQPRFRRQAGGER